MLDLSPRDRDIVLDILAKHVPQYDVWAFGSRAKNTAWRYSDLDLAIITDAPLSLSTRGHMAEAFSESDLPFRVDILDWATTSENFRRVVEADKILIRQGHRT